MGDFPLDNDGGTSNQDGLVAAQVAGAIIGLFGPDGAVAQALDGSVISPWRG